MLLLGRIEPWSILLLVQEDLNCLGRQGRHLTLQARDLPLLAAVELNGSGRIRLAGWRECRRAVGLNQVTLAYRTVWSAQLCRRAAGSAHCQPVHLELGPAPMLKGELLARSRNLPDYAVPANWKGTNCE